MTANYDRIPGFFHMSQVDDMLLDVMDSLKNDALNDKDQEMKQRRIGAINLINAIRRLPYFNRWVSAYRSTNVYELVDILKRDYEDIKKENEKYSDALNKLNKRLEFLRRSIDSYKARWKEITSEPNFELDSEARETQETLREHEEELEELMKQFYRLNVDVDATKAHMKTLRALQGFLQNQDYFKKLICSSEE